MHLVDVVLPANRERNHICLFLTYDAKNRPVRRATKVSLLR
jgi:hypothetical protein